MLILAVELLFDKNIIAMERLLFNAIKLFIWNLQIV